MQADKPSRRAEDKASQMHKGQALQGTAPHSGSEAMLQPTKRRSKGPNSLMQDLMREELAMLRGKKA